MPLDETEQMMIRLLIGSNAIPEEGLKLVEEMVAAKEQAVRDQVQAALDATHRQGEWKTREAVQEALRW